MAYACKRPFTRGVFFRSGGSRVMASVCVRLGGVCRKGLWMCTVYLSMVAVVVVITPVNRTVISL